MMRENIMLSSHEEADEEEALLQLSTARSTYDKADADEFVDVHVRSTSARSKGASLQNTSRLASKFRTTSQYFPKKVYLPWYQRYAEVLNDEERIKVQPAQETAQDEMDTNMRQLYGKYYKQDYASQLADPLIRKEMEQRAMRNAKKLQRDKHSASRESHEMIRAAPAIKSQLFECMKALKGKGNIQSRWLLLTTGKFRRYVCQENAALRKILARRNFLKVVDVIIIIHRFLFMLMEKHHSMKYSLMNTGELAAPREIPDTSDEVTSMEVVFNFTQYESDSSRKMSGLSRPVIFILTKPWFTRTIDEIGDCVKCLYPRWVYHKYPLKVQLQMATVAWYTKIGKQRPIVREGNPPTRFFILLSGQLVVTELIKGKYTPDAHKYNKFVKYINKGERFGDEEMDIINRKRFYNAYSTTACEFLTFDFQDYQESLLHHDPRTESAPPHIAFISRLPLFHSFSTNSLIRAAKAQKIHLFYFCGESVITASLEKSDFVFVVMHGQCYTAVKQAKLKTKSFLSFDFRENRELGSHVRRSRFSSQRHESECQFSKAMDPTLLAKRKEIISCSFMKSKLTQDFVREIVKISERSLFITREQALRHIKQIRVMRLIGRVYGHDCIRQIAEDLVEKMLIQEKLNMECNEEINKINKKIDKIHRKLVRVRKQFECMPILDQIIDRTESRHQKFNTGSFLGHAPTSEVADQNPPIEKQGDDVTSIGKQSVESDVTSENGTPMFSNNDYSSQATESIITESGVDDSGGPDDDDDASDDTSNDGALYGYSAESRSKVDFNLRRQLIRERRRKSKIQTDSGSSILSPIASNPSGQSTSLSDTTASASSSKVTSVSNTPIPYDEIATVKTPQSSGVRKVVRIEEPESLVQEFDNEADRPYSPDTYSPPITMYSKCDIIGNEYMNYNDGKYRRPDNDPALLSTGVEVVMVAKSFLVERLYNRHRKFDKLDFIHKGDAKDEDDM